MKYKQQFLHGLYTSVFVWMVFIIADLIDEFVLASGWLVGAIVFFTLPFIMIILYSKNYKKSCPPVKKSILWFVSYVLTYLLLWLVIFYFENIDKFIPQKHSSEYIDLNGIEYTLYGFSTLFFFLFLCILFHIIYHVTHKNSKLTK
jgi:NADH:ubiquinone oxidoreductase subunit 6 (subunit J)